MLTVQVQVSRKEWTLCIYSATSQLPQDEIRHSQVQWWWSSFTLALRGQRCMDLCEHKTSMGYTLRPCL